jgi:hypothetical protein
LAIANVCTTVAASYWEPATIDAVTSHDPDPVKASVRIADTTEHPVVPTDVTAYEIDSELVAVAVAKVTEPEVAVSAIVGAHTKPAAALEIVKDTSLKPSA